MTESESRSAKQYRITVTENGPYQVTGGVPLSRQQIVANDQGESVSWREGRRYPEAGEQEEYHLCRCGHSANRPFCDGTHQRIGFEGSESPDARTPYAELAGEEDGPEVSLTDAQRLCAFARFCDVDGSVWQQVQQPGKGNSVVRESANCPSGRLIAWPADGEPEKMPFEPQLPQSIGVVEDPMQGVGGPYWVRGGIRVAAEDGTEYELRNRVTLCRCGASANKPFCDGSHAAIGFKDNG
jgi:CDGSH-type Zn-finger protein